MSFLDSVNEINKKFPGYLPDLRLKDIKNFPHISTGSFILDWITGIGGLPRGRITEIFGMQSSGKTTAGLMTAAECQALGLGVLLLDFEHAIDPLYAQTLGVSLDPAYWAVHQPDTAEDAFRIADYFM